MKVENKSIELLKPYKRNNKKHDQTQIDNVAESIRQYGFVQPIVIDKNNVVVIGHCRLLSAKQLGMKEVPCVCVDDLTDEQVRKLRIIDNKTNESEWDFANLELELPDLDFSDFDIDFGFDIDDEEETEIVEDDVPEVDEEHEPTVKLGDIWQLGRHRLMCGDSTDRAMVEKLMNGTVGNLALTDPPYGINIVNHKIDGGNGIVGRGLENTCFKSGAVVGTGIGKVKPRIYEKIINDDTTETAQKSYDILKEFTKNQIIFGGNYFTEFLPSKACWVIWDKDNGDSFLADGEMAWTSFDKGMKIYKWLWNGMSREGERRLELKERVHPTQKPVGLLCKILEDFSKEYECILDLFGGSGSTLIACEQLDRICYTMELDPKYCDVIIKRWETLTGEKAVKIN